MHAAQNAEDGSELRVAGVGALVGDYRRASRARLVGGAIGPLDLACEHAASIVCTHGVSLRICGGEQGRASALTRRALFGLVREGDQKCLTRLLAVRPDIDREDVLLAASHNLPFMVQILAKEQRVAWGGGGGEVEALAVSVNCRGPAQGAERGLGRRDAYEKGLLLHEVGDEREEVGMTFEEATSLVHNLRDVRPDQRVIILGVRR